MIDPHSFRMLLHVRRIGGPVTRRWTGRRPRTRCKLGTRRKGAQLEERRVSQLEVSGDRPSPTPPRSRSTTDEAMAQTCSSSIAESVWKKKLSLQFQSWG